jgi:hypothetical protein
MAKNAGTGSVGTWSRRAQLREFPSPDAGPERSAAARRSWRHVITNFQRTSGPEFDRPRRTQWTALDSLAESYTFVHYYLWPPGEIIAVLLERARISTGENE